MKLTDAQRNVKDILTPTEQSLVDAALHERDAYMATVEGELQRNRTTALAEIVKRLSVECDDLKAQLMEWRDRNPWEEPLYQHADGVVNLNRSGRDIN